MKSLYESILDVDIQNITDQTGTKVDSFVKLFSIIEDVVVSNMKESYRSQRNKVTTDSRGMVLELLPTNDYVDRNRKCVNISKTTMLKTRAMIEKELGDVFGCFIWRDDLLYIYDKSKQDTKSDDWKYCVGKDYVVLINWCKDYIGIKNTRVVFKILIKSQYIFKSGEEMLINIRKKLYPSK